MPSSNYSGIAFLHENGTSVSYEKLIVGNTLFVIPSEELTPDNYIVMIPANAFVDENDNPSPYNIFPFVVSENVSEGLNYVGFSVEENMECGKNYVCLPRLEPYNANYTALKWTSSDDNVALISQRGVVTPVNTGNATITLEVELHDGTTKSNWRVVKVTPNPSGINDIEADVVLGAPVFSLSGQRLAAPRKGINIIGGKKFMIK